VLKSIAICPPVVDHVAALLACDDSKHFSECVQNLATLDQYPTAMRRLERATLGLADASDEVGRLNEAIKMSERRVRLVADMSRTLLATLLDRRLPSGLKAFRVATALGLISGVTTAAELFTFEHLAAFLDRPKKAPLARIALAALGYLPARDGLVAFDLGVPLPAPRRERAALALHCLIRVFYGGRP
jgi:hypothetical protein